MNWFGSGFITIINYSMMADVILEDNTILTENNFDLLTEASQPILVES